MAENMQKIKLLKLYELLRRETDEDHPISRMKLCQKLNEMGISSNVRTLSLDIETLNENGYEILSYLKDKEKFYYVPERELSVPEIKIILDALQAANFITEKKTEELTKKVAALGGPFKSKLLKENMVCFNTCKHTNESVYYNVDRIEEAIIGKKKINFHYFHLNEKAEREYVKDAGGEKKLYTVEPVALIFNEDNYYLMAHSSKYPGKTANYRIDRMERVEVLEESKLSKRALALINKAAAFTEQAFKMYGGKQVEVALSFSRDLLGPVYDKFGEDIPVAFCGGEECTAEVEVQVSPTFFGWLAQFGNKMQVVSPASVKDAYRQHIREILE